MDDENNMEEMEEEKEGMVESNMSRPDGEELTLDSVKKNIQVPPQLQEAYEKVVIAGMKVMFSEQTNQILLQELQRPGAVGEKMGKGVAGLLLLLFKESNETMPPQVIFPAGVELVMQAADFLRQTELAKVTNQDIGVAVETMIMTILEKFGVDPNQLPQMFSQFDNANVDAAAQQMGGPQNV